MVNTQDELLWLFEEVVEAVLGDEELPHPYKVRYIRHVLNQMYEHGWSEPKTSQLLVIPAVAEAYRGSDYDQ